MSDVFVATVDEPVTKTKAKERFDLIRTIVIAVCAAVAYLAVVIGLTVYCSLRLIKRKEAKIKRNTEADAAAAAAGACVRVHCVPYSGLYNYVHNVTIARRYYVMHVAAFSLGSLYIIHV